MGTATGASATAAAGLSRYSQGRGVWGCDGVLRAGAASQLGNAVQSCAGKGKQWVLGKNYQKSLTQEWLAVGPQL